PSLSVWALAFGTFFWPRDRTPPEEIGIPDPPAFRQAFLGQLASPFRWRAIQAAGRGGMGHAPGGQAAPLPPFGTGPSGSHYTARARPRHRVPVAGARGPEAGRSARGPRRPARGVSRRAPLRRGPADLLPRLPRLPRRDRGAFPRVARGAALGAQACARGLLAGAREPGPGRGPAVAAAPRPGAGLHGGGTRCPSPE